MLLLFKNVVSFVSHQYTSDRNNYTKNLETIIAVNFLLHWLDMYPLIDTLYYIYSLQSSFLSSIISALLRTHMVLPMILELLLYFQVEIIKKKHTKELNTSQRYSRYATIYDNFLILLKDKHIQYLTKLLTWDAK